MMEQQQQRRERATRRLQSTLAHLDPSEDHSRSTTVSLSLTSSSSSPGGVGRPDKAEEECKWNGWGYKDSFFELDDEGRFYLTGDRYELSGCAFPSFREWAEKATGLDTSHVCRANVELPSIPEPLLNAEFLAEVRGQYARISHEPYSRLFHAHGHTCRDVFRLRHGGGFDRIPDVVIWPGKHEHVEVIVRAASKHNVCIIPFGGGTTVTLALECPANEKRMIVSLDMKEMNRIKWIDRSSFLACIETGVVGKDLEEKLAVHGLTMGHEPDSIEFSTLGGWISTRASGMKKNVYGNIEDIVIKAKMVTPIGTLEKTCEVPRLSAGPDINQIILGSEGMFGVITEAVVRLRPIPEVKVYGSIVFPDWECGVDFMKELASRRWAPASIRLMDNLQFQFGQALKPEQHSKVHAVLDAAKKFYITKYKGFDVNQMCAVTMVFEGDKNAVADHERRLYNLAKNYKGIKAGSENGRRGYFMTYMIAYLRDFCFNYYFLAESFETSVPWSNVALLCKNVKERIRRSCKDKGIPKDPFISVRLTQTYDTGACLYFYFAFIYYGVSDPVEKYEEIEEEAREEVLACGGSISHHHGVGKLRKRFMPQVLTDAGLEVIKSLKKSIDPNNIFCTHNLIDDDDSDESSSHPHGRAGHH
eukprot:TRINITY_DN1981_c0_g2_i2.p1 TRINITY_DN1981_c0_g2~~TRINITY_DN1981_c0_g2_i2.p1  ORF type:complete len:645 (+),score=148.24 TRINITY_DN1981_c0_g2_i2:115-2049(+)